ncbi:MAG: carboxypeptidase regulatory-like domain-containing protein [Holophagaceae bacterium]|nr:carboxypeptidase regulatory-like domain-containing protein [Holophagaceae bacterium]
MRRNLVFTPLMVMLAAGGTIYSQDTTSAVLAGRVTNQDGQPLQGVRVLLESPSLLNVRQAPTDANGNFRVPLLPNGEYTVTYVLSGYITRKLTMRLIAGQTANGSTRLSSIDVQVAFVDIIGTTAQVDKTDTVIQTSYNSDFLEKVVGRNFQAIGQLAPGLNTASLDTQGDLSIRGGTGHGTKTLVNGTSVTEMWGGHIHANLVSLPDMIESIAIIHSPINSRYGNTDGGIVSVVTSKGSNTLSGSIRLYTSREGGWQTVDHGYPRRDGTLGTQTATGADLLTKRYEVTIKGPLWKDHITFAYGANLYPTAITMPSSGSLFTNLGGGQYGAPQDRVGTYYMDQTNGFVIRKPELYRRNGYVNQHRQTAAQDMNQFVLYGQINPQHHLEWGYTQATDTKNGVYGNADGPWNRGEDTFRSEWNVNYKGIIGSSGVLDFRMSRTTFEWTFGDGTNNTPIYTNSMASRIPINANGDLGDPNNYYASGLIGGIAAASIATNPNPYSGTTQTLFNGVPNDMGDAGGTTTIQANYQHLLNTRIGTHLFDFGLNSEIFRWQVRAWTAPLTYYGPGQIAWDLNYGDILDSGGTGTLPNLNDYRGKFIVFNVPAARYSDVDPLAISRYGITDGYFIDPVSGMVSNSSYSSIMPRVVELQGHESALINTNMMSYYINDLWSINDHHSLMMGARLDNFKVYDSVRPIHSYSQPTFRFEYKWDILGDQSRLLNLSWAQFHNNPGAGIFFPPMSARLANSRTRYWTGKPGASPQPYLVDLEDFLDLDNYGKIMPTTINGGLNAYVDNNFKSPISTEVTVGLRRNLSNGGSYKITFVNRTWTNDYDYYPDGVFTRDDGVVDIMRVLRNSEGNERSYKSLEAEWDMPITQGIVFGGSYTYARFMDNTSSWTDETRWWVVRDSFRLNIDWWWDEKTGGRNAWKPPRLTSPEHNFKFYLMFDLSSKKLVSSLTFMGNYTSGGVDSYASNGYTMRYGLPHAAYPELIAAPGGGSVAGSSGAGVFGGGTVTLPTHTQGTGNDSWNLTARYLVTVPLVNKFAWHARITITNPFNHRGKGSWFSPSNATDAAIVPSDLLGANGSIQYPQDNRYNGVWRSSGGPWDSLYQSRMGGRTFTLETGLRF